MFKSSSTWHVTLYRKGEEEETKKKKQNEEGKVGKGTRYRRSPGVNTALSDPPISTCLSSHVSPVPLFQEGAERGRSRGETEDSLTEATPVHRPVDTFYSSSLYETDRNLPPFFSHLFLPSTCVFMIHISDLYHRVSIR